MKIIDCFFEICNILNVKIIKDLNLFHYNTKIKKMIFVFPNNLKNYIAFRHHNPTYCNDRNKYKISRYDPIGVNLYSTMCKDLLTNSQPYTLLR